MGYTPFYLNEQQQYLLSNALKPVDTSDVLRRVVFIMSISNSRHVLSTLKANGALYVVTFDNYPAYYVLKNSPLVEEVAQKVASPGSLVVYKILSKAKKVKKNPDGPKQGDSLGISSDKLQPGDKWFESFTSRYGDWQKAWWREVLQNAVDTCRDAYRKFKRKGRIQCEIHTWEGNDKVKISVSDNGLGMDLNTLVKAFLTPGESTKREKSEGGGAATGGLGKAKEMLFFAWSKWAVLTRTDHSQTDDKGNPLALFVEAKYAPFMSDKNIIAQKYVPKAVPGTTVAVTMKKDRCVNKEDLEHIIELSSFDDTAHAPPFCGQPSQSEKANVLVYFRTHFHKKDETTEITEWVKLDAKNQITVDQPHDVLKRPDGSPWAEVYWMPHAKNYKDVVVRSNGLFLFAEPGFEKIPGKVIIELRYKPKGHKWNVSSQCWEDMTQEEATSQDIEDYGPLELLTEGRDSLLNKYGEGGANKRWKQQLSNYLESLKKHPEIVLKKKHPKKRKRAKNQSKNKIEFDSLFEKLPPVDYIKHPEEAIESMQDMQDDLILEVLVKALEQGDIDLEDLESAIKYLNELFTASQKVRLKQLLLNPTPKVKAALGKWLPKAKPKEDSEKEDSDEGGEQLDDDESDAPDIDEAFEDSPLQQAIKELEITAVDTGVDSELGVIYKDMLKKLIEEAKEAGNGPSFLENVMKMLQWEPDFILSVETEPPYPTAPTKFEPSRFGPHERRIAKFWVECIRLVHILLNLNCSGEPGKISPLQAGFLFENPEADEYLGEYVSYSSPELREECQAEDHKKCPKHIKTYMDCGCWCHGGGLYTEDIGDFRAVFIAPAMISPKSSDWVYRYNFSSRKDINKIVAIAFHEVIHASRHHGGEHGWEDHDVKMASLLTDDIAIAMTYQRMFGILAEYCAELYKIKEFRKRPKPGEGYYVLDVKAKSKPAFTTLSEARDYITANFKNKVIGINAYYWPKGVVRKQSREILKVESFNPMRYPQVKIEDSLENLVSRWDSYYKESGEPEGNDLWK